MSEPNECPRLLEAQQLWEGEIDPARAGEVRDHVARCPECRAARDEWERLAALLARGDPAAPLAPERRRQMKAAILAECAASLEPAGDAGSPRRALRPGAWPWPRPLRLALALAPLALAALLLLHAALPRRATHPVIAGGHAPHPLFPRSPAAPIGPIIARGLVAPPAPPRPGIAPHAPQRPRPAIRSRRLRIADAWLRRPLRRRLTRPHPLSPSPDLWRRETRARRLPSSASADYRGGAARARRLPGPSSPDAREQVASTGPRLSPPSPRIGRGAGGEGRPAPPERLVIQVDEPPARTRSVTHLTIIAAGDLEAPGAQLTVVKTRKEEALP